MAPQHRLYLAAALSVERPDTPEAYSRFYGRVSSALYATPCTDHEPASQQQVLACVHVSPTGPPRKEKDMTMKTIAAVNARPDEVWTQCAS